ncbi:cell division ATP-binding protein FtsE [Amnibacterium sp. CER49]|uniref:cell division ATP-binding protein FtsE n=1 Tax=Amnibacterium sp. CER49 TaxID=3039161 RepID=UPI002447F297|nr:cell division ATP-binding protein FtsE [Amnibacterium sp. CER49]MDH2445271.1 cell division ATP-binding protein FtsE [Amnibacterium sp. CER49]
MIRFDSVTKRYKGAPRPALDAVSLEIGSGEFVFLVGASGSGKSSLLRLMLREEKPTSGEIHVLGQRLTSISSRKVPYFRRSLGVVFQDFRLLPNKTVFDNVAFTLQVLGKSRGFIQSAVPDVLTTVGLGEKAQNLPNELSGGEQQRVAIARAVVNKPAILLADEPTGNLDPNTSDEIMQVLERINLAGTTVVMATHDVSIVDRLQKRVVELKHGHIIRDELEAKYVTSNIPIQRRPEPQPAPAPDAPAWARRRAQQPQPSQPGGESSRPATTPVRLPTGPLPLPLPQPADTGEVRTPIWARSETGPVATPDGERARAPWRAAPVAPPAAPAEQSEATSLFFAAPVPAPRPLHTLAEDEAETTSSFPLGDRRREARRVRDAEPIDLDDTGDVEGAARRNGRHRDQLPDHLDFLTGLGLRAPGARSDDDEVGPSS